MNESTPTLKSWHLISPILPRGWRSAIVLREFSSMSQRPCGVSNSKNMDTTGKPAEDDTYVPNAMKRTRTIWRKIAWRKLDVQKADNIIRLTQHLAMFTRKGNTWGETQEICVLPGSKKIVGTYMGENSYASVALRVDTTNEDNKYWTLVEKLIHLEANDWPKFEEPLKKIHSAEFYQAPTLQRVGNGERSMW